MNMRPLYQMQFSQTGANERAGDSGACKGTRKIATAFCYDTLTPTWLAAN
jgi:hypothetical protein